MTNGCDKFYIGEFVASDGPCKVMNCTILSQDYYVASLMLFESLWNFLIEFDIFL